MRVFFPLKQKKQQKFVSVIPQMPKWVEPEPIGVNKIFGEKPAPAAAPAAREASGDDKGKSREESQQ